MRIYLGQAKLITYILWTEVSIPDAEANCFQHSCEVASLGTDKRTNGMNIQANHLQRVGINQASVIGAIKQTETINIITNRRENILIKHGLWSGPCAGKMPEGTGNRLFDCF